MPPSRENIADSFVELFTTSKQDVKNAPMLEVPREEYMRCARLRAKICDAFADVNLSDEAALQNLPVEGVPDASVEKALEVQEAEHFKPNFAGPASMTTPDAADQEEVEAQPEPADAIPEESGSSRDRRDDAVADQVVAEPLLGLDEAHVDNPCARFAVLQRKLEILNKEMHKLQQKELQRNIAQQPGMELQVAAEGGSDNIASKCPWMFENSRKVCVPSTRKRSSKPS